MAKKKVFCYNCAYYLKTDGGISGLERYNKCGNPSKGFGSKKVKATAVKPAHSIPVTISPLVINKHNDCTGWMFLAEKKEFADPKKPKWRTPFGGWG